MLMTMPCYLSRNTALHMAAWQNQSEIVDLLLINGAWVGIVS